jgi:hypothetical protein
MDGSNVRSPRRAVTLKNAQTSEATCESVLEGILTQSIGFGDLPAQQRPQAIQDFKAFADQSSLR